jgi:REP element-mobilizing transposase RayT
MSHTFTNLLYHLVFATKEREPRLDVKIRSRLYDYFTGLLRAERCVPIAINGMADHVHIFAKIRQDARLSDVVRTLKARSSHWIRRSFPGQHAFTWQVGYAVFTVSRSRASRVRGYVLNQQEHHRNRTFAEELSALLRAHGIRFHETDVDG